ncbi:hypothetical protein HPB50_025733 [Hyalomma asiaticum]|uniref:Uncharacterized protein n=1 Tax=Hyalomma asiaticum TaxID=266040 RepID=A0ACB7RQB2_HYAAI|nr:hypothetical protein HPB50_025733 [Hyalomma asiaticum]
MSPSSGHTTTTRMDGMNVVKQRLVMVGIVICFGCIIAMGLFIHVAGGRSRATKNLPCIGQQCQEVVEFTESLMDHSVSPCTDFYRHVCGLWIKDTKRPSSFMIDVAQNFSDTLHEAFSRANIHGGNHELMQNVATFYNSCLTYLERDADIKASTDELFEFFHNILRLSLVNRFHTLLAFSVIDDDGNVTLKVTRWHPLYDLIQPQRTDSLKKYVSRFIKVVGKDNASDAIVEEVLKLDENRPMLMDIGELGPKLQDVQCENFPGKTWIEVLHKELSLAGNVPIITAGMGTICKELNAVLVKTNSVAKALYVLALVSANILHVEYKQSENRDTYTVRHRCYVQMQFAFEDTWLHLLSVLLNITKRIEGVVDAYMATIVGQVKSGMAAWTWMSEEDRHAALEQFAKIHLVRFYSGSMTALHRQRAVQCSSGRELTSAGFVSNMAKLYVRDIRNCLLPSGHTGDDLALKQLFLGTDVTMHGSKVVVPFMFSVPPLYYRHVEDDNLSSPVRWLIASHASWRYSGDRR